MARGAGPEHDTGVGERLGLSRGSVPDPVPHGTVMNSWDVEFVLRQLQESDERTRMHVHYVTPVPASERHVLVWISIAEDRVPGA